MEIWFTSQLKSGGSVGDVIVVIISMVLYIP